MNEMTQRKSQQQFGQGRDQGVQQSPRQRFEQARQTGGRDMQMPQTGERGRMRRVFMPAVDIYETADAVVLLAEMPGVDPQSVDITLERRILTVRGQTPEVPHAGYRQIYAEYSDGDYERVFTLSEEIDQDRIEASVNNGVLRVVLPKAEPAKARKIELKTG